MPETATFTAADAPTLNLKDVERDTLPFDVAIVGAGPAGLACALHLARLVKKHDLKIKKDDGTTGAPEIAILEKGAEIGHLGLSGGVMDPRAIQELLGDEFKVDEIPHAVECVHDATYFLTQGGWAIKLPIEPPTLRNKGKIVLSLSQLVRWLKPKVEAEGVMILEGMPAALPLYQGEGASAKVVGVQCRDKGIDKHKEKKGNFEPGANIVAKVTVLAEGPRGSIAKYMIPKLGMDEGRNPQTYATGVKEIWKLKEGTPDRTGHVYHTMGAPLGNANFGGGWVYFMKDRLVSVGFVTYLDYEDPMIDPHREFQKFKSHPFVKRILDGAEVQDYGAKTFSGGGWWSVPRVYADGVVLVGDTAGFVNTMNLKGIHYAIKSGMLAAETIFEALKKEDYSAAALKPYQEKVEASYIKDELWKARNFHQSFGKGLYWGILKTGFHMALGGRGLFNRLPAKPDKNHYKTLAQMYGNALPDKSSALKYDGKYTFDKVTDIYHSGTTHEEDQPAHLLIADPTICVDRCAREYGNPCERFCPAGVYEMVDDATTKKRKLQLNFSNCVHCKTCDIKDPYGIIDWVPPEGGGGPKYKMT